MMATINPFSPELQHHLLSHFNNPSDEYLQSLSMEANISFERLKEETQLPGSKFNDLFADNPLLLYKRIEESYPSDWQIAASTPADSDTEKPGKTDYTIQFDAVSWPAGIGEDQLIAVSDLDKKSRSEIRVQTRHEKRIKTLLVDKMPVTRQLVLIVSTTGDVITAFPGRWFPPFNEELLKEWVFLVRK